MTNQPTHERQSRSRSRSFVRAAWLWFSIVGLLGCGSLWLRAYGTSSDWMTYQTRTLRGDQQTSGVATFDGAIYFGRIVEQPPILSDGTPVIGQGWSLGSGRRWTPGLAFAYYVGYYGVRGPSYAPFGGVAGPGKSGVRSIHAVGVPFWALMLLLLLSPIDTAFAGLGYVTDENTTCVWSVATTFGATPERCPECGTVVTHAESKGHSLPPPSEDRKV